MSEKPENYSRDADQTRYLWLVGIVAMTTLLGFFVFEGIALFKYTNDNKGSSNGYKALIFTPEIVHTLIPVTLGGITFLGGFLFGRERGKRITEGNGRER